MRGRQNTTALCWLVMMGILACGPMVASGQQAGSNSSAGGITFNPPRRVTIRHRAGRILRGDLISVTPEQVSVRVESGKEIEYPLTQIRSLITADGEIKFTTANDTYGDLVEMVRELKGVKVTGTSSTVAGNTPAEFPRPPAPQMAVMLDSPDKYQPRAIPAPPPTPNALAAVEPKLPNQPPPPPAVPATVSQPFHETSGFKIGFVVACLAVIAMWWRSRVG